MSYTQRFTSTISISRNVSYPSSEKGGPQQVTLTEPLEFVIEVDTRPVDGSVGLCQGSVAALDGAIVSGANLQVKAKRLAAERISDTVIDEFNGYISQNMTQEMAALRSSIAAQHGLLQAEAQAVGAKRSQFMGDYSRIKERYASLFANLNAELKKRVKAIDQPIFDLVEGSFRTNMKARTLDGMGAVYSGSIEGPEACEKLAITIGKKRVMELLRKVTDFLLAQRSLRFRFDMIMLDKSAQQSAEICVSSVAMEVEGSSGIDRSIRMPDKAPRLSDDWAIWDEQAWHAVDQAESAHIERAFFNLVGTASEELGQRELEYVRKLWAQSKPLDNANEKLQA
jgi:hypothetical protein